MIPIKCCSKCLHWDRESWMTPSWGVCKWHGGWVQEFEPPCMRYEEKDVEGANAQETP